MNSKEFKNTFNAVAREHGFEKAYSGWFKESQECILVLDLQKSNFGDYYEMNVKIFVQGVFNNHYVKSKYLVKNDTGDIFTRPPKELCDVLTFDDIQMTDVERLLNTKKLFNEFIVPFAEKAMSISGIRELESQGTIFILPAVKEELQKLSV
jgi:hypothetical protein